MVIVPRREYEEVLKWRKFAEKRMAEERDTDEAIGVYKREKRAGKLKSVKSLADLD